MSFKDIVGQDYIISKWKEAYVNNRLHPVQLLQSHEGAGALPLAISFGQFLLCEHNKCDVQYQTGLFGEESPDVIKKSLDTDSCGVCGACVRVEACTHPDMHFFYPVINVPKSANQGKEKCFAQDYILEWKTFLSEHPYGTLFDWIHLLGSDLNKQPNISAAESHHFNDVIYRKAYEGKKKVIVFWLPEFLGKEANRLLKSMEDLPKDTFVFFVSSNPHLLLSTFKSRCLTINVPRAKDEDIRLYLKTHYSIDNEKRIQFLLNIGKGNLTLIHRYLDMDIEVEQEMTDLMIRMINSVFTNGPIQQVDWINSMSTKSRSYIHQFLSLFQFYIHTTYQLSLSSSTPFLSCYPSQEQLVHLLEKIQVHGYIHLLQELVNSSMLTIRRNGSIKMELHHFLINLHTIFKKQSLYL